MFTNPTTESKPSFHHQNTSPAVSRNLNASRLHIIRKAKDAQPADMASYARDGLAPLVENGKPQVKKPDSNALDKDWLKKNTCNLRAKKDQYRSTPKAVEHVERARKKVISPGKDELSQRPNPPAPSANPPTVQHPLTKTGGRIQPHSKRDKNDRHRVDNPKPAERAESAQKRDQQ